MEEEHRAPAPGGRQYPYIGATRPGRGRTANGDRIMIAGSVLSEGELSGAGAGVLTALVCDGVGSCPGGEAAAELAAGYFASLPGDSSLFEIVSRTLRLGDVMRSSPERMAAAFSGLQLIGERFIAFNLGDVRVYRCGENGLRLLSSDHTRALRPEDAAGVLTRYLGQGQAAVPSVRVGTVDGGDRFFLLCSDGVYRGTGERALTRIVAGPYSLGEKKRAILNLAVQNGSRDDLSVVLIACGAFAAGTGETRKNHSPSAKDTRSTSLNSSAGSSALGSPTRPAARSKAATDLRIRQSKGSAG